MKTMKKITIIITIFSAMGLVFACSNIDSAYAGAEVLGDAVTTGDTEASVNPDDTADPDGEATPSGTEDSNGYIDYNYHISGHNFSTTRDEERSYDATCQHGGRNYYQCSHCKNVYWYEDTAILDHHNYELTSVVQPTCDKAGTRTYTCSWCHDSYTETIAAALGHDYVLKKHKDATCTSRGSKTYVCSTCGKSYTKTIAALGHNYVKTGNAPATCVEDGVTTYKCSRCGVLYTEAIAKTGHNYEEISEGTYQCGLCGDTYTNIKPEPVLPNKPDVTPSSNNFNALSNVLVSLMIAINALGLAYLASFMSVFKWVRAKKAIAYANIFGVK